MRFIYLNDWYFKCEAIPFTDITTNGTIDTFVKYVSLEMPPNTRINDVVNPTFLAEAWDVYEEMMAGFEPIS